MRTVCENPPEGERSTSRAQESEQGEDEHAESDRQAAAEVLGHFGRVCAVSVKLGDCNG